MQNPVKCFLFVIAFSMIALSQSVAGNTQFAAALPARSGEIIQYSFPVSPFYPGWEPDGHAKKFSFSGSNVAQMETVRGVTELYLSDSHDLCGPKGGPIGACSFLGTLSGGLQTNPVLLPSGATYKHITGNFFGLFVDDNGNQFQNTLGLLSFDTYPTVDGVVVPSAGSMVIVLENN